MIPIVDDFVRRFKLGKDFVVIADAGLMSTKNIKLPRDGIIGARIKKESGEMVEKIIATGRRNSVFNDIKYPDGDSLVVGESDERVKKNAYDREEGVERIRTRYAMIKSGKSKKSYRLLYCGDDSFFYPHQ